MSGSNLPTDPCSTALEINAGFGPADQACRLVLSANPLVSRGAAARSGQYRQAASRRSKTLRKSERTSAEILRLARHDTLTDLLNRGVFTRELAEASKRHAGVGGRFTVMMLDLGKFKTVNDTLGHPAADRLLIEAAAYGEGGGLLAVLVKPIGISRPPHLISRAICSKIVPPMLSKQTSTASPAVTDLILSRRSSFR
jgi:hypothetical protein